ncbi:MAG TPA: hypothetical protein PK787_00010 [Burkholderiaceae bacterium]|nr:hypothetical protein [Burkholderiaceae bacterium]
MPVKKIFSFLTYPKKNQPGEVAAVSGTQIPLDDGKLCKMLKDIFDGSAKDCNVPVMFVSDGEKQENVVRTELLALLAKPAVATAAPLAKRLQGATSGTSGMGLLFICIGDDGESDTRLVISRFPADEGVVAEKSSEKLTVQFVEQVFLKSAYSYKSATYVLDGRPSQIWKGHVVDKQINHGSKAVADYWIVDFLLSELSTTAAQGTKRLANAMKLAIQTTSDVQIKAQITFAAQLAANLPKKAMTISDFCDSFHLSEAAKRAILSNVNPHRLVHEKFRFDVGEFSKYLAYKQVELDSGAVMTAPVERFDECFKATRRNEETVFVAAGHVVDEKLKRTK